MGKGQVEEEHVQAGNKGQETGSKQLVTLETVNTFTLLKIS